MLVSSRRSEEFCEGRSLILPGRYAGLDESVTGLHRLQVSPISIRATTLRLETFTHQTISVRNRNPLQNGGVQMVFSLAGMIPLQIQVHEQAMRLADEVVGSECIEQLLDRRRDRWFARRIRDYHHMTGRNEWLSRGSPWGR